MAVSKASDPERFGQAEDPSIPNRKRAGNHHGSVISHRDEPAIECCIEVWSEEKPIEDVETLAVALAVGPRLDMAGSEHLHER